MNAVNFKILGASGLGLAAGITVAFFGAVSSGVPCHDQGKLAPEPQSNGSPQLLGSDNDFEATTYIERRRFSLVGSSVGIVKETNQYAEITYDFVNRLAVVQPANGVASVQTFEELEATTLEAIALEVYKTMTDRISHAAYSENQTAPDWGKVPNWAYESRLIFGNFTGLTPEGMGLFAIEPPNSLVPPTLIP
jgi:hypothetical protein